MRVDGTSANMWFKKNETNTGPSNRSVARNDRPGGLVMRKGMAARAATWLTWSPVLRPIASAGYGKKQANAKSQAAQDQPRRAGGTARMSASIAVTLFTQV